MTWVSDLAVAVQAPARLVHELGLGLDEFVAGSGQKAEPEGPGRVSSPRMCPTRPGCPGPDGYDSQGQHGQAMFGRLRDNSANIAPA